jgi:hypothetical protein
VFPVVSLFRLRVSHHLDHAAFPAPASSNAACGFPALRSPVCFASRIMRPLSLRLDVYSPPQVLQIDGRICHRVLAFLVVGDFTNSRAPSLHGRYPASTLLRTHPSPSRLRSTSRLSRLIPFWPQWQREKGTGLGRGSGTLSGIWPLRVFSQAVVGNLASIRSLMVPSFDWFRMPLSKPSLRR